MNTQVRDLAKGLLPPKCSAKSAQEGTSLGEAPAMRMRSSECGGELFARRLSSALGPLKCTKQQPCRSLSDWLYPYSSTENTASNLNRRNTGECIKTGDRNKQKSSSIINALLFIDCAVYQGDLKVKGGTYSEKMGGAFCSKLTTTFPSTGSVLRHWRNIPIKPFHFDFSLDP